MCGTQNDPDAETCKSCGYIFEDFSSTGVSSPAQWGKPRDTSPPATDNFSQPPRVSTDAPLFVVSKSLLGSLVPGIVYLLFISFFVVGTNFSIYSLGIIAIFILIGFLPVLFSTRSYEFFDGSLRMNKIIGASSEITYSDLEIRNISKGRRVQIILSAAGQRRAIVIPGNPTNRELGEDLIQFLEKKLKKKDSGNQPTSNDGDSTESP
jgi:hypothetical protein